MSEETQIMEKNCEFTGLVESLGSNGEGIVHMGETVFFAPFTAVGEKVKFRALKVKNRIGYAKALEILTPADERVRPRCPLFTKCGGCQLQHLRYGAQLKLKSKTVRDALRKIAGIDFDVPLTVKSDFHYEYRNKLQIPVGVDKNGENVIGFYAERSHRIVPVRRCPIHPYWAEQVIAAFAAYMVTAVTAKDSLPRSDRLVALLRDKFKSFSLWQNVNGGDGNGVFGREFRLLYGEPRFAGHECGVHFEAGPNTFLQVNRGVCRKLKIPLVQIDIRVAAGAQKLLCTADVVKVPVGEQDLHSFHLRHRLLREGEEVAVALDGEEALVQGKVAHPRRPVSEEKDVVALLRDGEEPRRESAFVDVGKCEYRFHADFVRHGVIGIMQCLCAEMCR